MKENFQPSLNWVLLHEGGWSDHPDDPGGATSHGITLAVFRYCYGQSKTKDELRRITAEQIEHIYRVCYWNPGQCDHLPAGVDYAVFDAAVHDGLAWSVTWLQRAVDVYVDGIMGQITLAATAWSEPITIINQILDYRLQFLHSLKIWPVFGNGWQHRLAQVRGQALQLAIQDSHPAPPG